MLIGIIVGFISLTLLVVAHEFGHAFAAKRSGVVVEEFGIGMPPTICKKKLKNGINLSLNWLFIGGFVKLQGEYDEASQKGDYGAATIWQKTRILFAGVAMNWLVACFLLTMLALIGMPKVIDGQFAIASDTYKIYGPITASMVIKGSAAAKAGVKAGDTIIEIDGQKATTSSGLLDLIHQNKGKTVNLTYSRDDVIHNTQVKLGTDIIAGCLGVSLSQSELTKSTWSAPIVGVATTGQFTAETIRGVGQLFKNLVVNISRQFSSDAKVRKAASTSIKSIGDNMAGPVGIVGTIFPAASKAGLTQIIMLVAIISVSLAVMNILPIPALDGGRWLTTVLFKLSKKELTMKREEKIQTVGFAILMGLVVLVTILDVKKIF